MPEAVVLAAAALLLFLAVVGAMPPSAAVALAAAAGTVLAGVRLSRLAATGGPPTAAAGARPPTATAAGRPSDPPAGTVAAQPRHGRWSRRAALRRRVVGLLDAAVATAGLTAAVPPIVAPAHRSAVVAAGVALTGVLLGGALFLLPGRSRLDRPVRLRRVVEVVSFGVSLVFATWVLLPPGELPPAVRELTVVGAGLLAGLAGTGLADRRRRPGAALCWTGAAAVLLGLGLLLVLPVAGASDRAALLAVPPLLGGMLATATGAARLAGGDPPRPAGPVWPTVTAPAAIATVAAACHLLVVGEFDVTGMLLGLAVIPPMVVRELLSAADNRRYADRLGAQEAHFRALVSGGHDLVLLLDEALRVRWQSPAAARLFGLTDADVRDRPLPELLHPQDAPCAAGLLTGVLDGAEPTLLSARLRDGQGNWRETESTVSDQRGVVEVGALVLHVRDVGDRRRLERTVHRLAATDQLTGLANRVELLRALGSRRQLRHPSGALLVVDLHGLGGVNDAYGRAAGDVVLVEVARRLRGTVGPDELVARLTGDEFAVVTTEGPVLAFGLGDRLVAALSEPYPLPDAGPVRLAASVGLAEITDAGAEDVLRQADLARRRAVQLGRNRVEWYDGYLEEQLVRRLDLERELPGAVARGELDLVYQPVLGLIDRCPVGTEALLRWRSPVLGTVLPAELLPVAGDLDLLGELGRWVLARACRQLADWSAGSPQLWMAVNVTPRELAGTDFVERAATLLAEHGVPGERLVIEVSEPLVTEDAGTVAARLAGLRSLGVRIALDDFRPEHASLAQLRRLPIDLLKVGPELVGAADDPQRPLLDVVVSLADRLGVAVVAEQLESIGQVDRAHRAGCRYGQGFVLARPATAERVEAYFEEFPSASR
ncbi:putative bifunctional diguanylate cyclase/phosphodiesterase [Micromonospora mirobrigensis]|uniref:putative bifunctional diguanylate cyclase/phosphodiesterase n=1 Tax=Micromonospora mirobrigensis TaxID=262898 RepID=UPI001FDF6DFC|nr:GGDEF domain-containing phosphodiesterase [Micromonospora mirobrigensis]